MVSADPTVRFYFNNGVDPVKIPCTTTELAMVDAIFVTRRRHLATKNNNVFRHLPTNNNTVSRQLKTFPGYCKRLCDLIKSCRVTNCGGFDGTNRNLLSCSEITGSINQKLDALSVSSSCKSYLHKDKRISECFDDTRYGEVLGAKLWTISGSTQTSLDLPSSGYKFCKSKSFNIQAILNECVDVAGFRLDGPNGYTYGNYEKNFPYSLFGDYEGKYHGTTLSIAGTYTLKIKPDNYSDKEKIFTFTVDGKC